jgi:hypothetical protein
MIRFVQEDEAFHVQNPLYDPKKQISFRSLRNVRSCIYLFFLSSTKSADASLFIMPLLCSTLTSYLLFPHYILRDLKFHKFICSIFLFLFWNTASTWETEASSHDSFFYLLIEPD